jgi:hypothetical protein
MRGENNNNTFAFSRKFHGRQWHEQKEDYICSTFSVVVPVVKRARPTLGHNLLGRIEGAFESVQLHLNSNYVKRVADGRRTHPAKRRHDHARS